MFEINNPKLASLSCVMVPLCFPDFVSTSQVSLTFQRSLLYSYSYYIYICMHISIYIFM